MKLVIIEEKLMADYWGYHLMLDCSGCSHDKITNRENIVEFTRKLVERIDMVAFGEPVVERFATHDPNKAGYSMMQLIETSNIAAHFVESDNTMYLDVFSCKPYDNDIVIASVEQYFDAQKVKQHFITRNAE
jgi:S-adenosylmethionine decarboxylase